MTTTVRTIKNSQHGTRTRTTTKPLAFCGLDNRGAFAMRSKPGTLTKEEPLIIQQKLTGGRTLCKYGDGSETWIERK